MEVVIVSDAAEAGALVGQALVDLVARSPKTVLGLATGSSPLPIYDYVTEQVGAGAADLSEVTAFTLDEYLGLPVGHPESYRAFIRRVFTDAAGIREDRLHSPCVGSDDVEVSCAAYEDDIRRAGGIAMQILGIGSDGHIGFNEPTSSLGSRTRIKTLVEQTRIDNARFFDDNIDAVPMHVVTQGIGTILDADHVVMVASGEAKAEAVAEAVEGPLRAMVPASALQLHRHATVVLDEAAAGKLQLADYYRNTFERKPSWQSL